MIGANPASLAELLLFCDRQSKGSGTTATVLKISRESVIRAARLGLKPAEIITRLAQRATNALPSNVAKEIQQWSSWVCHVNVANVTIIQCGTSDAADRVVLAFERRTQRLGENIVAIDQIGAHSQRA